MKHVIKSFASLVVVVLVLLSLLGLNLLVGWQLMANAQGNNNLPPAIISFASDLKSVTLDALESGAAQTALSWQTVGLTDVYLLQLHQLIISDWAQLAANQELPPSGAATAPVQPSRDFAPPTYRLSIIDRQGRMVSQSIVTIPFDMSQSATPSIVSFNSGSPNVDFVDLAAGQALLDVSWRVQNRVPTSNLVFEQVLPNGDAVSVELPRMTRWISSNGQGVVAPRLPDNDATSVQIRMRVVDLRDGQVYGEAVLNIGVLRAGTVAATASGLPTPAPTVIIATVTPNQ